MNKPQHGVEDAAGDCLVALEKEPTGDRGNDDHSLRDADGVVAQRTGEDDNPDYPNEGRCEQPEDEQRDGEHDCSFRRRKQIPYRHLRHRPKHPFAGPSTMGAANQHRWSVAAGQDGFGGETGGWRAKKRPSAGCRQALA